MINKRAKNYRTSIQTDASNHPETKRNLHIKIILRDTVNDYQKEIYTESIYRQLCGYGPDPEFKLDGYSLDIKLDDTVLTESELKKKVLWNEFVKEIEKVFPVDNEDEFFDYLKTIEPLASKHGAVEDIGESSPIEKRTHQSGPGECLECQQAHLNHTAPFRSASIEFTATTTDEEADDYNNFLSWSVLGEVL